ncbi:aldo/keto reductase [Herbiconiux sp. L3-i23]|uniref:aldo/keto reductase n=1 Tax=Herbiconiux sp. L3-i23 TaxID=2905871 RepID=UPI0020531FD8|nr:aldo/keto reductase [Herbiconiux sp. L3-i23]BDI22192.1 NADP-dependent aryl-alcohol dehydrogenase [Herbiconiux sp. L3-i23]
MTTIAEAPLRRSIGPTGLSVYPYGIDGSVFGWSAGYDATIEVLSEFAAAGGTLISTADHYAGGRSEIMIGAWLERQHRADFVVATKVGRHPDAPGLSARSIKDGVDASLERLRTDYIDILSFDGEHPETPLEESLTAVAELIARGSVGHLALAAYSGKRAVEAMQTATRLGIPAPEVLVAEYSLMERSVYEGEVAPVAEGYELGVIARLPLASGYLRGDFRTREDLPSSPMFAAALRYVGRRGNRALAALEEVSHEVGENIGRVAIAWVLSKAQISAVAIRAKDGAQLLDLIEGARLPLLNRQQIAHLDRVTA